MKYKLINTTTKEEHLCEKVTIDGFDYYVSDTAIGYRYGISKLYEVVEIKINYDPTLYKGIICSTNPNIDILKVVDEVEILAESIIPNLPYKKYVKTGFIGGYNKSQETHPFSEEDMIEFGIWCLNNVEPDLLHNRLLYCNNDKWGQGYKSKEELLQIWKEQQPKIVYYMNNIEILKNHLLKTGVRISKIDTSLGWVYICFETVDVSLLQRIGALIESLFKKENRYTHLLPKFMGKDGMMCLCISEDVINQINK